MWFFREIFRLIWMIAVATAAGAAIGCLLALVSGRDLAQALRISFLLIGCLLLLLAGAGSRSTGSARRVSQGLVTGTIFFRSRAQPRPDEPTLTATAVFVGSGLVL